MPSTSKTLAPRTAATEIPLGWTITNIDFDGPDGPLSGISTLQFHLEGTGDEQLTLIGSASRAQPQTDYAIMNGEFMHFGGLDPEVSFDLTIDGFTYHFRAKIDGDNIPHGTISGSFQAPGKKRDDEGSWVAKAQTEEDKKHPGKGAK